MPDAKNHDRVKVLLQREVDSMKKSGNTIGVADSSSASTSARINSAGTFTFDFDESSGFAPVTFASGSAVGDQPEGLAPLTEFMDSC
jgi:hypothetical protein